MNDLEYLQLGCSQCCKYSEYIKNKKNRNIFVSDKGIGRGGNPKFSVQNDNNFNIKTRTYSKTYTLEDGTTLKSSEKIVSYWSEKFYKREYEEKRSFYDTLKKMLEHPESFPSNRFKENEFRKYLKKDVVIEDTGELIDSNKIKVLIDKNKIKKELALLGWYSIVTSETNMSEKDIIATYHNLVEIEDQFRVMKSTLETRPLHVRTEEHIIAHLTICTIAHILLRLIQKKVKDKLDINLSADRIQESLKKWQIERLSDQYLRFNDIDDEDLNTILKAYDLEIPKKLFRPIDVRTLKSNVKL